jgi:hypothetical protein
MKEEWRPIAGYLWRYHVSNLGRVKSYCSGKEKILKPGTKKDGYLFVNLSKNGTSKTYLIHRLVAQAFIPNLDKKTEINHKDGNKQNNCVKNLEWVTHIENCKHASKTGLLKNCKNHKSWKGFITIFTLGGDFVVKTNSLRDAEKWLRENTKWKRAMCPDICKVISKKRTSAYGYIFERTLEKK